MRTLTGISALGYLHGKIEELKKEYEERGSAVEVVFEDGKYEMRIRNDYVNRVKQFAQEMELKKNALRTLAYLSKHDGALKSELAKRIGPQIYQDVQELIESDFIIAKKAGRSAKLFLTEKFKRHFNVSSG